MGLYAVGGNRPRIHPTSFIHPLASIIGRVEIGPGCYIGAGASIRGDWATILVGAGSNVQDSCTVHGAIGETVVLEEEAHLGHGCIVHGAHVGRDVLIGMNAVVLDGAVLGDRSVVGSGCVVPAGLKVPPGMLVVGVPGRVVGEAKAELRAFKKAGTGWYQQLARRCRADFAEVDAAMCAAEEAGGGRAGDPGWTTWFDELS
ncbi:MAG: gamma carbonic anhydrase family protein [Thermoleophilia bacterium]